ncbi:hypothetical protein VIGAN_10124800 [Vigna angularis var. angularis]|uniref:Uncharacterized protein n=1 Tax=Vigna angularis var. angularis TaxID=157739 RepID=A0A0S3T3Q3_PHAAN|nr:hypothetical protein VIGAN_10124800 [Vigna angularis var. angularis]
MCQAKRIRKSDSGRQVSADERTMKKLTAGSEQRLESYWKALTTGVSEPSWLEDNMHGEGPMLIHSRDGWKKAST